MIFDGHRWRAVFTCLGVALAFGVTGLAADLLVTPFLVVLSCALPCALAFVMAHRSSRERIPALPPFVLATYAAFPVVLILVCLAFDRWAASVVDASLLLGGTSSLGSMLQSSMVAGLLAATAVVLWVSSVVSILVTLTASGLALVDRLPPDWRRRFLAIAMLYAVAWIALLAMQATSSGGIWLLLVD